MTTLLAKLLRRGRQDRSLFFEALGSLIVAKFLVHTVPFRRLASTLGRNDAETPVTIDSADRAVAVKISWAVQTAARYVPLGFVCLPQALAAQRMLRRRGLASTLYFGVAPTKKNSAEMLSHAWLRVGDKILTGEQAAAGQVVVAKFADDTRRTG